MRHSFGETPSAHWNDSIFAGCEVQPENSAASARYFHWPIYFFLEVFALTDAQQIVVARRHLVEQGFQLVVVHGPPSQPNGRTPISAPCNQNANSAQATTPTTTVIMSPLRVPGA